MLKNVLKGNSVLLHAVVLVAISLPYCINLGASSIWDANEAFYAETPREMLVTGDYLAPQFNYQPRAQKPPLTYWVILLSYQLFGVGEFAVRLPGALAAIGVLLFSYGTARMLFSPRAALFSAVITATSARVFILARRLPIDILLLFFLTGTLFFLIRAVRKRDRASWALAYACAGLGFLTKGPVAAVIPAGAYVLWGLWRRRLSLSEARPLMGAAIFACIVIPWYAVVYGVHGWTYISPFFLRDNLGRFLASSMGPSRGPFYYFSVYATDFFPWSLVAALAVCILWLHRKREQPLKSLSFGLPLVWCAFIFVLFSLSKNKQEYYIAPIYPVAAVILSGILDRLPGGDRDEAPERCPAQGSPFIWIYGFLAILLLLFALAVPYALGAFMPDIDPVLHYGPSLVFAGGFALLAWNVIRREHLRCFLSLAVPLWVLYMMCALVYLPALEPFRPVKSFCSLVEAQSNGDDEAGYFGTALPSMAYYLRRPIFEETSTEQMLRRFRSEKRVFCVMSLKDFGNFANKEDLKIHILDRRSRFAARFGALLNAGYLPGEELLLVSNRPYSETKSGRSGPKL